MNNEKVAQTDDANVFGIEALHDLHVADDRKRRVGDGVGMQRHAHDVAQRLR